MTYIPKLATQLQSFPSVEDMNHHMNLHYVSIKNKLTRSYDSIFHLIKRYACVVAGVCWLKQESLAKFADVSVKTVERGLKYFKELGVLKIYYTKRSNGLNGNCYYVLQPFQVELHFDEEEIVSVEEGNVGAGENLSTYDTIDSVEDPKEDKLLLSSTKALESSLKTEEEEINNNAHARATEAEYRALVQFLVNQQFSEKLASEITNRVLASSVPFQVPVLFRYYAKAVFKFQKRLSYKEEPIISLVDYFVCLVVKEAESESDMERETQSIKAREYDFAGHIGMLDILFEKRMNGRRMVDYYAVR